MASGENVKSSDELAIHHIKPVADGGTTTLDNLILIKKDINHRLSDRVIGSGAGGAILGASLAGPLGMIIGGIIGAALGKSVDEGERNG